MTDRKAHWDNVYATRGDVDVSWFEATPALSLRLIKQATDRRDAAIDIGGGASRLADALLDLGFADVACLDLSTEAQQIARARLGPRGDQVHWVVADVTDWNTAKHYDVWHDRAAFHFLVDAADQQRYAKALDAALTPGGVAIIGTFAPDGPERCSGLPIVRHDSASLSAVLGNRFQLLSEERYTHQTPSGAMQKFQFSTFRCV